MPRFLFLFWVLSGAAFAQDSKIKGNRNADRPFVNQAGYNLGEAKRFTVPGVADGTPFSVFENGKRKAVFSGKVVGEAGDFTTFNPVGSTVEYVVEVPGHGRSVPFWVADHLMEKLSSRLAYQFFIDVRGGYSSKVSPAHITGGGPSRDGGGQTLEATFEGLLYASNPALFDRWNRELRYLSSDRMYAVVPADSPGPKMDMREQQAARTAPVDAPDLLKLLLWHAQFAYNHHAYTGLAGGAWEDMASYDVIRLFGYQGKPFQHYDYQNNLDQLAATCAFYHYFLKPWLPEKTYQAYRKACLDNWEKYERQKEVRYWVYSMKWIDEGWREFSEQGNAFGQGLLRNLLMYEAERHEPGGGESAKFLRYAQDCARDVIQNWNFDNEWHTWAVRNAEHITPQALAYFLMLAPEQCPPGAREKLAAWADYVKTRSNNLWQYRTHSDTEWAHRRSKEVGTVCGLGGAAFAVASVLGDANLREIGWSQVNNVFGLNPSGAHLSNKSAARVALGGYWEGVETGWPYAHIQGTGELGYCRGTMDGSPTNHAFPFNPDSAALGDVPAKLAIYGTEGWAITNRAWLATVAFSTTGSHAVRMLDDRGQPLTEVRVGNPVTLELKAALNQDWTKAETGYVLISENDEVPTRKITLTETGPNTGVFRGQYTIQPGTRKLTASYGYLGFEKKWTVAIR